MKNELIVHTDPKSPISETFRTLRTNIQFMYTGDSTKAILITSTMPGEGKSWTSSNLAVAFAQSNKKVLLIDSDMRKGKQYKNFDVSPVPGLSNYLSRLDAEGRQTSNNITEFIQPTEISGLYVIPAGNIPPNPSELLDSGRMIEMIQELKSVFDIILFDGAPCALVSDSIILSRLVDLTIVVAQHNSTKTDELVKIKNQIQNVGGKIAGVIINKVPISSKKYESSYYYGASPDSSVKKMPKAKRVASVSSEQQKPKRGRPKKEDIKSKNEDLLKDMNRHLEKAKKEKAEAKITKTAKTSKTTSTVKGKTKTE